GSSARSANGKRYRRAFDISLGMTDEQHRVDLLFDASDEYRPEPPPPPEIPAWKDGSVRIGIHTSIAGDICNALELAHGLGANALQIFSASPRMWAVAASRN